ncbi:hypothetical protein LDENG_00297120 [Lucifuga dentata]|nr:hypothetical protein LDENG_00297120 [Lucifuga dentata]
MTDDEVQVAGQLTANSPLRQTRFQSQQEDKTGKMEPESTKSLQATKQGGDEASCSSSSEEARQMDNFQSIQLQLHFLISKADDLHNRLLNWQGCPDEVDFAALVPTLLYTCQPYFNYLESTARTALHQNTPLSSKISSKLFSFSQQLCERLEQLVLTYANSNLLSLNEAEPDSVSHFCIGRCEVGQLRLTTFVYPQPMPYLAWADTGLYKRMRWNVERLRVNQPESTDDDGSTVEREEVTDTEYYFLCYEDIVVAQQNPDRDGQGNTSRMWTIGQWSQVSPDPDTEDIYDWILCDLPQAEYKKLLFLGSVEPSACSATTCLLEVLLAQ